MALSPQYGWAEPDNSSLVKNGAQDIRALGDAIDTSVWNVGYGQAGKNKIINGDFGIWQRGTTFTNPNLVYTADRFRVTAATAVPTWTVSQQTFTPGTAPVAGYESANFLRMAVTSQGSSTSQTLMQRIEDVRQFAGQTVSFSFWAKAASTTTINSVVIGQNFGSGGSAAAEQSFTMSSNTVTTSWQRFTGTLTVASVSGKTIGTSSYSYVYLNILASAGNYTLDTWGWQLEAGSKATPFQTASGGSIQGELAMCQRYYLKLNATTGERLGIGNNSSTTVSEVTTFFPVQMRIAPTALEQSGTAADYTVRSAGANTTLSAVPTFASGQTTLASTNLTVASGLTAGNGSFCRGNAATAYFAWSAEL